MDQALRKFKRRIADDNKLFTFKEKEFFEKRSEKKKRKKASAVVRERKRQEKFLKEKLFLKKYGVMKLLLVIEQLMFTLESLEKN